VPLILAIELRSIVVADAKAGLSCVEILTKHQAPRFLQSQLLLKLQGAHGCHGLEVGVEPRGIEVVAAEADYVLAVKDKRLNAACSDDYCLQVLCGA
jgi:hypothetical protein